MESNFNENMKKLMNEIDVDITENQISKFYDYMNLLLEWNEKINLTAITKPDEIILKHFVDCLTIQKYIEANKKIVDIGTGAGFPGVPLAIMNDRCRFTLVDSLNKRINFLNEIKDKLNLKNVSAIHSRAEEFDQNKMYRENFDIAVSRAVANLCVLSEYLLPAVKVGGKVICMKGSQIEEELNDAKFALKELGGKVKLVDEFLLPGTDMKRNVVVIEKVKETPKRYPRKAGTPAKQPLK